MTDLPAETEPREGAAIQRIRVGAIGLACVFLLVMLATVLLHAAADGDLANQAALAQNNEAAPAEPLAQLGVAPGNGPTGAASNAPVPAPSRH